MDSDALNYAKYREHRFEKSADAAPAAPSGGGFGIGSLIKNVGALVGKGGLVSGLALGAYALSQAKKDVKNDAKRRAVFEALCWDPTFRDVDKGQLLDWFTTIYHFAPDTTLDKVATKELLRQFMTFGRVDLQTLKTLSGMQESMSKAKKKEQELRLPW